jgi:8-oxo-dGTP diphosphatase
LAALLAPNVLGSGAVILLSEHVGISRFIRYIFQVMTRAAVAILQKDKRILICQRKKTARYALKWEFPGGKVERGESFFDCLRREVREELTLTIEAFDRSESQINRYDDGGVFEVMYFFVSRFEGMPVNNAFEQIRWVTLDELQSLDILEGNKPIVARMSETMFL